MKKKERKERLEKQKQVQIPEEVFWDSLKICYIVLDDEIRGCLSQDKLEIVERFQNALEVKLNKMVLHDIYSKSKDTNLTDEERELRRIAISEKNKNRFSKTESGLT